MDESATCATSRCRSCIELVSRPVRDDRDQRSVSNSRAKFGQCHRVSRICATNQTHRPYPPRRSAGQRRCWSWTKAARHPPMPGPWASTVPRARTRTPHPSVWAPFVIESGVHGAAATLNAPFRLTCCGTSAVTTALTASAPGKIKGRAKLNDDWITGSLVSEYERPHPA